MCYTRAPTQLPLDLWKMLKINYCKIFWNFIILWLEMIKVSQIKDSIVMRQVDGVNVPSYFLPIRNVVKVAHASILRTKTTARSNVAGISWSQLIGENRYSFAWLNLNLSDNVLEWNRWEDLFDGRR